MRAKELIMLLKTKSAFSWCLNTNCDGSCSGCPFDKEKNLKQLINELEQKKPNDTKTHRNA